MNFRAKHAATKNYWSFGFTDWSSKLTLHVLLMENCPKTSLKPHLFNDELSKDFSKSHLLSADVSNKIS